MIANILIVWAAAATLVAQFMYCASVRSESLGPQ